MYIDGSLFCWVLGNEREGVRFLGTAERLSLGIKGKGWGDYSPLLFLRAITSFAGFFRGRVFFVGYQGAKPLLQATEGKGVEDSPFHLLLKSLPSFFVLQSSLLGCWREWSRRRGWGQATMSSDIFIYLNIGFSFNFYYKTRFIEFYVFNVL